MQRCFSLLLFMLFLLPGLSNAQLRADSLLLTLPQASSLFMQNNLALIAQQYNIDINTALVQQSRYLDNPVLNTDQNIYDGGNGNSNGKFFRHSDQYGQVYIQLQQLIRTAGKRHKQIKLAHDNVLTATQQFNDVMRNLRFILHNDFSTLNRLFQTNTIYNNELVSLQSLVVGMDAQLQAGNISQKENIRVKSLLFSLRTEQAELQRQVLDIEKEVHTLLHNSSDSIIVPTMETPLAALSEVMPRLSLQVLLDSAKSNRPDFLLAQTNLLSQQHNLSYQKALAVPDVSAGIEFDQRSSYAPNYYGLALSLPIPVFNKNKGNIRAAQTSISLAQNGILAAQEEIIQDVNAAWHKLLTTLDLQKLITPEFTGKYDELMQNVTRSYQSRQIGLIEFIDFFDAYKEARIRQLQQEADLRSAAAELNFTTGANLIDIR